MGDGTRSKKTKFSIITKSYWSTAWTMPMYWGRFFGMFLKLIKMYPFRQAITISSICNKVFWTMFLKPDTVGSIPRWGYCIGDRQSVESLQWLSYIGRKRNNVTHAGNGRGTFRWGTKRENWWVLCRDEWSLWVPWVFWHGCPWIPNRHKHIDNTEDTLRAGMKRQWKGSENQKSIL
jgi:hypothetical protein